MPLSPLAGKPAPPEVLIDVDRLIAAYYDRRPTPTTRASASPSAPAATAAPPRTARSTRRTSWRSRRRSASTARAPASPGRCSWARTPTPPRRPRCARRWRCWPRNGVETRGPGRRAVHADAGAVARDHRVQPRPRRTPASPTASSSRRRTTRPRDGGFKYNPPHGGPADSDVTDGVQARANELLARRRRHPAHPLRQRARRAHHRRHDFLTPYVDDLPKVVDVEAIARAGVEAGRRPDGRRAASSTGRASPSASAWTSRSSTRPSIRASRSCRSITTARSAWTAPAPTRWPACSRCRIASPSRSATTPTPIATAS